MRRFSGKDTGSINSVDRPTPGPLDLSREERNDGAMRLRRKIARRYCVGPVAPRSEPPGTPGGSRCRRTIRPWRGLSEHFLQGGWHGAAHARSHRRRSRHRSIPEQYFTHCRGILGRAKSYTAGYFGTGGRTCAPDQGVDRENHEDFLCGDDAGPPMEILSAGYYTAKSSTTRSTSQGEQSRMFTGRRTRLLVMGPALVRLVGLAFAPARGLIETQYLWQEPVTLDMTKFARRFATDFIHDHAQALQEILAGAR